MPRIPSFNLPGFLLEREAHGKFPGRGARSRLAGQGIQHVQGMVRPSQGRHIPGQHPLPPKPGGARAKIQNQGRDANSSREWARSCPHLEDAGVGLRIKILLVNVHEEGIAGCRVGLGRRPVQLARKVHVAGGLQFRDLLAALLKAPQLTRDRKRFRLSDLPLAC